jgi:predicted amidohydrolase
MPKEKKNGGASLHVAAIQMAVNEAPTDECMVCAEQLVADAIEVGAQLVHLSECFKLVYRKGQRLWRTA